MTGELPDDLDLLLALDVFLRERHVTRAARRLGVTQGAASQRLSRLRAFFGDPLLVPGRPLLVPTPRAQAIAKPLAQALTALRAAVRAGAPFDPSTSTRRFVILGGDLVEAYAAPLILDLLAREAPGVSVSIERTDLDFADRLEKGSADMTFVPDFMIGGSLRRRALAPERFVVLLRKGHPAARGKLDLDRYLSLSHVLVAPRGMPGSIVDGVLEKRGLTRRVVARVQHFVSAPMIVASSDLAVTCPETVFRATAHWFPIVALEPPLDLPIDRASMVWHECVHDDPGHVWLRQRFDAWMRERAEPARKKKSGKGERASRR